MAESRCLNKRNIIIFGDTEQFHKFPHSGLDIGTGGLEVDNFVQIARLYNVEKGGGGLHTNCLMV